MRRAGSVVVIVAVVAGLAACTKTAPPPNKPAANSELEQRVEDMARAMRVMNRNIKQLRADLDALKNRSSARTGTDDDAKRKRIVELERRIARLSAQISRPRHQVKRPDPKAIYAVPVAGSPQRGPKGALVTMVMGFEFACPHCMRVSSTIDKLKKSYGKRLRVVYKHYVVHPARATLPALAACAAHQQRKFMGMYRAIFANYGHYSQAVLEGYARKLKLNMRKFKADMAGTKCKKRVRQDQMELARVGARGTPSFFINGRFLGGNRPYAHFKTLIDEEMKKARKSAVPASRYYQRVIMVYGKKSL